MDATRLAIRSLLTEDLDSTPLSQRLERLYKLELEHADLKARPDAEYRHDLESKIKRLEADAIPLASSIASALKEVFDFYIYSLESEFPDVEAGYYGSYDDEEDDDGMYSAEDKEEVAILLASVGDMRDRLAALERGRIPFGQMMVLIHQALNTAHHSGSMMDHVTSEHPDVTVELLDRLSAGELTEAIDDYLDVGHLGKNNDAWVFLNGKVEIASHQGIPAGEFHSKYEDAKAPVEFAGRIDHGQGVASMISWTDHSPRAIQKARKVARLLRPHLPKDMGILYFGPDSIGEPDWL